MLPHTNQPLLIVGDLILDEYLIGKATRLSREAAVPVLERTRRHLVAGGAANPAVNLATLGAHPISVGVVGNDSAGHDLKKLLVDTNVDTESLVVDESRPTTTKTRIVAEGGFVYGQHLARIDYLERRPIESRVETGLVEHLRDRASTAGAIVVSNYRNGVITDQLVDQCRRLKADTGIPLLVDSQGGLARFSGFDLIKCNRNEAEAELGTALPVEPAERAQALKILRERCDSDAVVVTLGSDGITWLDDDGHGDAPPLHRAAVFDATGAGDTVIAALSLSYVAGVPLAEACELANAAAGLAVQVLGNYAPTVEEIEAVLRGDDQHMPTISSALP